MDELLRSSYKIMHLEPGASLAEVEKAHRDAAWLWHPDRFPHEPHIQEKARARIREINVAYERLKFHLKEKAERTAAAAPPGAGPAPGKEAGPAAITSSSQISALHSWIEEHATGLTVALALAVGLFLSPLLYSYLTAPTKPPAATAPEMAYVAPGAGAISQAPLPAATPKGGAITGRQQPAALRPYFGLGSSQDEVWALQGPPQKIAGDTWKYGLSTVTFNKNHRVISYSNFSKNLRVQMVSPAPAAAPRRPIYFTVGSTKERVLTVQGNPTGVVGNAWKYGESEVKFRGDRVVSFEDTGRNLEFKGPSRTRAY